MDVAHEPSMVIGHGQAWCGVVVGVAVGVVVGVAVGIVVGMAVVWG